MKAQLTIINPDGTNTIVPMERIYNKKQFATRQNISAPGVTKFLQSKKAVGKYLHVKNDNGVNLYLELDNE
jgi:hypothetical protein